jgi:ankyrin repeat protein
MKTIHMKRERATSSLMKRAVLLGALLIGAPVMAAEPAQASKPPSALFAEEAERDLAKAAELYAELLALIDAQRKLEATALFRLAEIRARQGKPAEAVALHQRLLAEYPKDEALVKLSRERLAALGSPAAAAVQAATAEPMSAKEAEELKRMQAVVLDSPDLLEAPDVDGFTPLLKASLNGWIHVVTFLLDHGAAIDGHPEDWVPLGGAARGGHKRVVELLLARGAKVNADYDGWTALHSASNHNRLEVARVLLQAGAKVDAVSSNIMRFEGDAATPLLLAVNKNEVAMATLLLDHGADPSRVDPGRKQTPLLSAVEHGREALVKLLLERKAKVDQAGAHGMTPLLLSAQAKRTAIAKLLLQAGARVDSTDERGFTAVHHAAQGNLPLVEALLAAGASAKAATKEEGWTPIHTSLHALKQPGQEQFPLATYGKIWATLIAKGADINAYSRQGYTPLQGLCAGLVNASEPEAEVRLKTLDLLVEHGADPTLKTKEGATIFQLANHRRELEKRLLFPKLAQENAISVFTSNPGMVGFIVASPVKYQPQAKDAAAPALAAILQKTDLAEMLKLSPDWQMMARIYRRGPDGAMVEAAKVPVTPEKKAAADAPPLKWGDVVYLTMEQKH